MASIRKRILPSGKPVWLVDFKDTNGKRRARQFQTKREADAFTVTARAEVASGIYVHDSEANTVEEAAMAWLAHCVQRCNLGRRMDKATLQDYEAKIRLHVLNAEAGVGAIKLSRLTRKTVNEFRDRLLEGGRSEAQTRKILSVLSLVIKHAQDDGLISQNPVQGVRVFRSSRVTAKVKIPTKEEVRRLIDAAAEDFKSHLKVAAICGLRASESRGLQWEDIDYKNLLIHVRRRADAFNEMGQTKSNAGSRSIPMGPLVANALRRWRLVCPPSSIGLVFPTNRGTIQFHSNILKRHFKPLCRRVGIDLRWRDLRHFAVSLWIEQGFTIKEVVTFAGHSSVQMTMDRYGHLFPSPDHQRGMVEVETRLLG